MSTSLQTRTSQNDWSVGEVRDVAPALISTAGAYSIANALLDEDGNPYQRGGTEYKSKTGLGSSGLRWIWDGFLGPGARSLVANGADFGVLGTDDETLENIGGPGLPYPGQSGVLADILYIGGGIRYAGSRKSANYSTGTVSVTKGAKTVTGSGVTWNTLVDAGMFFKLESERSYVVASVDSSTSLTLREPWEGSTGSAKKYALESLQTGVYEGFPYVTVCANRVVIASGRTIKFTEVNKPWTFTNSLGTTNEHTVPAGVQIIGLASLGQTVLVFTTAGVWTLDGLALDITDLNGNAQHRLQLLSGDLILAGAAGIAGSGQRLVVPCGDGIYLMDGVSQPVKISKPIDRVYMQRISDGYRLGQANVYRSHYFLPIITSGGKVKNALVCRLDRPTRDRGQTIYPWSHLTGDGGEITAYATRATVDPQQPQLFGAQAREPSRVVDCSRYFEPDASVEGDADGSIYNMDIISRDYETGGETINAVRSAWLRYELSEDNAKVQLSYSTTSSRPTGAIFGTAVFGVDQFASEGLGSGFTVAGEAGPSDARDPARFRINKKARYIRFRIKGVGAASRFVLRSFSLKSRPSGATRR